MCSKLNVARIYKISPALNQKLKPRINYIIYTVSVQLIINTIPGEQLYKNQPQVEFVWRFARRGPGKKRTHNTRFHIYFNHRLYTYTRLGFLFAINRGLNIGDAFCVTPGCYARAVPNFKCKIQSQVVFLYVDTALGIVQNNIGID